MQFLSVFRHGSFVFERRRSGLVLKNWIAIPNPNEPLTKSRLVLRLGGVMV